MLATDDPAHQAIEDFLNTGLMCVNEENRRQIECG
jgi:hypothetical protein